MDPDFFYNALGLAGMVIFLVVYGLLQAGRLSPHSLPYSAFNLIGAVLILASLAHDWNLSAFLLEAAWALISVAGIVNYYRKKAR